MKTLKGILGILMLGTLLAHAERPRSPFGIEAGLRMSDNMPVVRLNFTVPAECVLYSERLHFETAEGQELVPAKLPAPVVAVDKVTGHEKKLYDRNFAVDFKPFAGDLIVKFQGCSNAACFFPEKRTFTVNADGVYAEAAPVVAEPVEVAAAAAAPANDWHKEADQFTVVARETGYIKAGNFVNFLNRSASGHVDTANDPLARYKKFGLGVMMLLIVLGGLGLNLTPCVLPLIPINLAIIGAGKAAHTRREGFLHGATYGAGVALAYGVLGLVVVLTGAKFGTLNSSVWFNVGIALVFGVLSLAMFGRLNLDFSRYEAGMGDKLRGFKSHSLVAFGLGAIAALLAGACVAPVVISVLLLATDLHAKGMAIGLALPFLLGLGMALPWPFMGASLSFLPKPGKWMERVKQGFGVVIILFACYYGHLAWGLWQGQRATAAALATAPAGGKVIAGAEQALTKALQEAKATGKPVFVDFAASWCKNCEAMDATVFNQSNVQTRLKEFIVVRYSAERPNEQPAREVLDHFGVMGLPTYVVLSAPKQN